MKFLFINEWFVWRIKLTNGLYFSLFLFFRDKHFGTTFILIVSNTVLPIFKLRVLFVYTFLLRSNSFFMTWLSRLYYILNFYKFLTFWSDVLSFVNIFINLFTINFQFKPNIIINFRSYWILTVFQCLYLFSKLIKQLKL